MLSQRPVQNSSARPNGPQTKPLTTLLIRVTMSTIGILLQISQTKCGQTLFPKGSARKNAAYDSAQDMLPAQKTFALSFCLRDRPIRPYTFGTRFLRASPECGTPGAPGGTSCDFVLPLCTAVHGRKTLSYFRLLGKPFTAFYAPVSSFIPEGEFYFGMTFSCLYRSMGGTSSGLPIASSHSSAFSWGGRWGTGSPSGSSSGGGTRSSGPSAPSKPWARPSGLASPSRRAVSQQSSPS